MKKYISKNKKYRLYYNKSDTVQKYNRENVKVFKWCRLTPAITYNRILN